MIISYLNNDVKKKEEIWKLFSQKNQYNFLQTYTKSRDINKFQIRFVNKNINVIMEESDTKPLSCNFEININQNLYLEISPLTLLDKLSFIRNKKCIIYHKFKIKSNNNDILINLDKDKILFNLINNSEFIGLYAFTKKNIMKVKITSTYFVDTYEKLVDVHSIICCIIEQLIPFSALLSSSDTSAIRL